MQLSGRSTKDRVVVYNGDEASIRLGSYDLRIGKIIVSGKIYKDNYIIQPQEMVILISQERVRIPRNLVGYALPQTNLGQEGILALSTGIIDPGYEGLISTAAINFEQAPRCVRFGDRFLRLVFHEIEDAGDRRCRNAAFRYLVLLAVIQRPNRREGGKIAVHSVADGCVPILSGSCGKM